MNERTNERTSLGGIVLDSIVPRLLPLIKKDIILDWRAHWGFSLLDVNVRELGYSFIHLSGVGLAGFFFD